MFGTSALRAVDIGVFVIANVINLVLVAIFLARTRRKARVEHALGWITVAAAIPLAMAVGINVLAGRPGWYWALPLVTVVFLAVEFLLDYVLKTDFRHGRLLAPYLVLYYLSEFAMIGYSFLVGKPYGLITLVTYFINLGATFYSYARVGHG
jgi:hypothetical protein